MNYQIHYSPDLLDSDFTPYGGNKEAMYCKEPEFIVAGPAETGKTMATCWRVHLMAMKYAGLNGAIVRKTQADMYGSVLQTFERVIVGAPVEPYGGEKVQKYTYSNGSVIWIGGMDKPGKVLSSERDFVYVNQAEQLTLDDWESITTRTTGRGAVMPYTMTFGDCNPGGSRHWIKERERSGALKLITTTHHDNPTLYDPTNGKITPQGERTMGRLNALTGIRHKRLMLGQWATAEGAVYDMFDSNVHVFERDPQEMINWYLAIDEGYTNPAVILLVGEDTDKRHHIFREFYKRGVLQSAVVTQALEWKKEKRIRIAAVDAAAAGLIADMLDAGIPAQASKGRVLDRIQSVQNRLRVQGDGKARLTIDPSCKHTINDFESRVW